MQCHCSQVLSKQNSTWHTHIHAHTHAYTHSHKTPVTLILILKTTKFILFFSLSKSLAPFTDSKKPRSRYSWYVYLSNQSSLYNHILIATLIPTYAPFAPLLFPFSCQAHWWVEALLMLPMLWWPALSHLLYGHPPHLAWMLVPWATCSSTRCPLYLHLSSESSAHTAPG